MTKFDLHMHTRRYSPDSEIDPFDLVRRAREIGLDGIVITEHDRLWPEDELEELRRAAPGLVVLGGVEVSGRNGDLLCYGVRDLTNLRRGMVWGDLCREIARQGGAAVAAHPYRWGQDFDRLIAEERPDLTGLEMMSNNLDPDVRRLAAAFLSSHPGYATLGNSDAHEVDVVGVCYTEFDADVRTAADLVRAIRERTGRPRARDLE
jgi:predicted metal-dependent phosphoesterase TrpH